MKRINILIIFVTILSILLFSRLIYLQIIEFDHYKTLSLKNQISIIPIAPPRGIILDRHGVVLADNIPIYALEITPEHVHNLDVTIKKIRKLLPSITNEDVKLFYRTKQQNHNFVPIPIKLHLTQEEVAIIATQQYRLNGVNITAHLLRYYPLGLLTAHIVGYVGRINLEDLKKINNSNYRGTNFIGKTGIERYYEKILHGKIGYQQVETDVSGRSVRVLNKQNPESGKKLYLTIDINLQAIAYEALNGKRGAIVAINPKNGEILAMVSAPSYDPNVFVNGINTLDYQKLSNIHDKPLYNRAVRGLYPPASTIKPYIALAGLENNIIDLNYRIFDPGWYRLPNVKRAYHDWKKSGHGVINVKQAIMMSCDTYFYNLGHNMGINKIVKQLNQFGFGQLTQIDLFEEAAGLLPTPEWKKKIKGVSWYSGDTLITAIGQGFMLASPLQLAHAVSILSEKGMNYRPHLLLNTKQSFVNPPIILKNTENWDIIIDAMHEVIINNSGTGYRFGRDAKYEVAGKTGTAEVFSSRQYKNIRYENIPEFLRDHSLFIAFAPLKSPKIAIAVMVENDFAAASIARQVLDKYFQMLKTI